MFFFLNNVFKHFLIVKFSFFWFCIVGYKKLNREVKNNNWHVNYRMQWFQWAHPWLWAPLHIAPAFAHRSPLPGSYFNFLTKNNSEKHRRTKSKIFRPWPTHPPWHVKDGETPKNLVWPAPLVRAPHSLGLTTAQPRPEAQEIRASPNY